jgi:hypothetical protein
MFKESRGPLKQPLIYPLKKPEDLSGRLPGFKEAAMGQVIKQLS